MSESSTLCVDTLGRAVNSAVGLGPCHGQGRNQLVRLNAAGQLGVGERCLEEVRGQLQLVVCRLGTVDGPWQYVEVSWRGAPLTIPRRGERGVVMVRGGGVGEMGQLTLVMVECVS